MNFWFCPRYLISAPDGSVWRVNIATVLNFLVAAPRAVFKNYDQVPGTSASIKALSNVHFYERGSVFVSYNAPPPPSNATHLADRHRSYPFMREQYGVAWAPLQNAYSMQHLARSVAQNRPSTTREPHEHRPSKAIDPPWFHLTTTPEAMALSWFPTILTCFIIQLFFSYSHCTWSEIQ